MKPITLLFLLFVASQASATSYVWMSAQRFLDESDLIAVIDISTVHEASTPEGLSVQSANATIVTEIYRRFPAKLKSEQNSIVIYSFDPNAIVAEEFLGGTTHTFSPIQKGKAFVCLKMRGSNKFFPFAPLCFQPIDETALVSWPTETTPKEGVPLYSSVRLAEVIQEIEGLRKQK